MKSKVFQSNDHAPPRCLVVIPAKNEELFIADTLNAVLNQQAADFDFKIVVVDNESIDNTSKIVTDHDGISLIKASGNISAVRNNGARHNDSDYVAFLDSDCLPPSDWLKRSIELLNMHDDAVSVSGTYAVSGAHTIPWIEKYWIQATTPTPPYGIDFPETLASFCFVVRRDAFEEIGGFDERLDTCEDADLELGTK